MVGGNKEPQSCYWHRYSHKVAINIGTENLIEIIAIDTKTVSSFLHWFDVAINTIASYTQLKSNRHPVQVAKLSNS